MKKRLISRALALIMALSLLSTTAFADVSFREFQNAIDKGESIYQEDYTSESGATGADKYKVEVNVNDDGQRNVKLWDDVVYGSQNLDIKAITICNSKGKASNVVLDLNGHKIDGGNNDPDTPSSEMSLFSVWGDDTVSLTVRDTSAEQSGMITGGKRTYDGDSPDPAGSAVYVKNATFNFESGNITGNVGGPAVEVRSVKGGNAVFNMTGGNITGNENTIGKYGSVYIWEQPYEGYDTGSVSANITGGNISNNKNGDGVEIQINSNPSVSSTISGVQVEGGNAAVSIRRGTVKVGNGDNTYTLSVDENSNVSITDSAGNSVNAILDAKGNRISAGALREGASLSLKFLGEFSPVPVGPDPVDPDPGEDPAPDTISDSGVIDITDFTADVAGTAATTIEGDEVPLAGLITCGQLVSYLYEREGSPDGADAEGEYTLALAWAVANGIVGEDADPEEIVTVAILKDVMANYAAYLDTTFDVVIEDEDDMIVMNCDEILAEFYASLEAKAA